MYLFGSKYVVKNERIFSHMAVKSRTQEMSAFKRNIRSKCIDSVTDPAKFPHIFVFEDLSRNSEFRLIEMIFCCLDNLSDIQRMNHDSGHFYAIKRLALLSDHSKGNMKSPFNQKSPSILTMETLN